MPKSSTTKSANKRVKVRNLPVEEKTLTAKEAKKVKGGATVSGGIYPKPSGTSFMDYTDDAAVAKKP